MNIEEIISNPATTVVDVRETAEFAGGHFDRAINIPLGIIPLLCIVGAVTAQEWRCKF
jgi:rhodanese-related sulfurtransferase